ncbi:hypothetical protein LCGC14_0484240 [marine sediment metagenome]|uniref:Uncharacterized protein n=1 Tax=marine sediment metagenome TaxID=412755 RepID=A0A0F9SDS8_9ZZZZ|nr:hypothetical protein [Methylophaga sp.]HEC58164.1 hypothetical protein [Methylophaga sp.]
MAIQTVNSEHYNGINWSAILAGAVASAAFAILLSILGAGLGLSIISPWSHSGVGAATIGLSAILWLSITQIISSGMGGFLAGRLRSKWFGVHADEVYFTDTVHGFLTWAIALIISVTLFTSFVGSLVNKGMQSAEMVTQTVATATRGSHPASIINDSQDYYLDVLLRTNNSKKDANNKQAVAVSNNMDRKAPEIARIFTESVKNGSISDEDSNYLSQLIAKQTGLSVEEAKKRIDTTFASISQLKTDAKQAADSARKASAYLTLWGFIALLIGAFSASYAATIGGRYRRNDIQNVQTEY